VFKKTVFTMYAQYICHTMENLQLSTIVFRLIVFHTNANKAELNCFSGSPSDKLSNPQLILKSSITSFVALFPRTRRNCKDSYYRVLDKHPISNFLYNLVLVYSKMFKRDFPETLFRLLGEWAWNV